MKTLVIYSVIAVIFLFAIPAGSYAETAQECALDSDSSVEPSTSASVNADIEIVAQSPGRLEKCLFCCARKENECFKEKGEGLCRVLYENCVATCTSRGETPSDWGLSCWTESGKK